MTQSLIVLALVGVGVVAGLVIGNAGGIVLIVLVGMSAVLRAFALWKARRQRNAANGNRR